MATEFKVMKSKAPEPKPESKVESKATTEARFMVRTLWGAMVDPHTGLRYGTTPCENYDHTPWVQSQIDAKKMELVPVTQPS